MRLLFLFFGLPFLSFAVSAQQKQALAPADTTFTCNQVETLPAYPGGTLALLHFFRQNLHIPEAVGATAGKMIFSFEIDKQGYPGDVKVIRSLHPELDSTAIALFKKMPRWKPALLRGRPVRCTYIFPLLIHTR